MRDRVFTGDTLLIRGTGRTDFQNGIARAQYDSLFSKLLKLPDETLVFPGPRLQGRHGLHHRRGEALQSAPAGEVGRRVCRPDEQPQPAQPEDDGRGGAGQHARRAWRRTRSPRKGWAVTPAAGDGAGRHSRTWRWSTCASSASARSTASIPGSLHAPYPDLQDNIRRGGMLHELASATGKRIVFYCAFGERSAMAVQAAQDAGHRLRLPHPRRHRRLAQGQRAAGALSCLVRW